MSAIEALSAGIPPVPQPPRREPKNTLDQSDFLTLMTAQLKNQDPTKPVDNQQYVQQMAMFSQLAGTTETNAKLAEITGRLDTLIAASNPPQE
jgi:flagellar basal-body rod modification protein FlgD